MSNTTSKNINLDGTLTIQVASVMKEKIFSMLKNNQDVVLNLVGAASIDLSFIQIICAAHRTARENGYRFQVNPDIPEDIASSIKYAGFAKNVGCGFEENENCIWRSISAKNYKNK